MMNDGNTQAALYPSKSCPQHLGYDIPRLCPANSAAREDSYYVG
jgi:hypothetical protein